jgi:hypothetical protein
MRRSIVAALCAGLLATAQAQSVGKIITPAPISIVLTIGQWLTKDSKKLYYIEVESRAQTFEQAKQEGFRLAVEHAVGSLILSETEVRTGRLSRDDIITYSSGYVDRFEIVQRENVSNGVILTMKVWVAHSSIADRLLNQSTTAGQIDGERSATQIETITQSRQDGDRVLAAVLADYPSKSFDIKMDKTQVVYDQSRQAQLYVSFYLSWNRDYINSLAESLKTTAPCKSAYSSCRAASQVIVRMPGFTSNVTVGFYDDYARSMIQRETLGNNPSAIMVAIKDFDGHKKFKQCFYAKELDHRHWHPWYYVELAPGQVIIHGDKTKLFNTYIPLNNLPVKDLDNVEISIVRQNECN